MTLLLYVIALHSHSIYTKYFNLRVINKRLHIFSLTSIVPIWRFPRIQSNFNDVNGPSTKLTRSCNIVICEKRNEKENNFQKLRWNCWTRKKYATMCISALEMLIGNVHSRLHCTNEKEKGRKVFSFYSAGGGEVWCPLSSGWDEVSADRGRWTRIDFPHVWRTSFPTFLWCWVFFQWNFISSMVFCFSLTVDCC